VKTADSPVLLMKIMRYLLNLLLLLACFGCASPSSGTRFEYETKSYRLNVMHPCPEGCVSCDYLRLTCLSKATGSVVHAKGRTWHTTGADGVTPSRFLGYIFMHDGKVYRILPDGTFEIAGADGKVEVEEKWKMKD